MTQQPDNPFVSRGGLKLRHALDAFTTHTDPTGLWCADLGCSTGGFTDCLLQAGAERVFAVDTAYGELAWKLRQDDRVTVLERSNALHVDVPAEVNDRGGVDLIVIDLGWTPQSKAIPAALRWIQPERGPGASPGSGASGGEEREEGPRLAPGPRQEGVPGRPPRIITLIKPHYEVNKNELGPKGVLDPVRAAEVVEDVLAKMPGLGVRVLGCVESPITGGKKKGKGTGNKEWLAVVEPGG